MQEASRKRCQISIEESNWLSKTLLIRGCCLIRGNSYVKIYLLFLIIIIIFAVLEVLLSLK